MIKREELESPSSCLSKAENEEMVFVLLSRDPAASIAVRAWIEARLAMGKNTSGDAQIQEAQRVVEEMQRQYTKRILGKVGASL